MTTSKKKFIKKDEAELSPEEEQIIQQTLKAEKEERPHKTGLVLDGSAASDILLKDLKDKQKYPYIKDLQTTEEDNPKKLIEWVTDNNIDPVYFATTYEQYLKGDNKTVLKLKELQQEDPTLTFSIAQPLAGIPEADIAKMARDEGLAEDSDEQEQEAKEEGR